MSAIRDPINAMKCSKCDTDHVTRAIQDRMNAIRDRMNAIRDRINPIRDLMNAMKCRKCSSDPPSQLSSAGNTRVPGHRRRGDRRLRRSRSELCGGGRGVRAPCGCYP
jgi:ribosomal protein L40E